MTSIIQAMNSRGVAFATDSAVSWNDGHARPSAQKLFSLPGRQPIAYMIMGSGRFAPTGLSWDRIFYKYNLHYTEKYGREAELDTVEDYEKDFVNFLGTLYSPEENDFSLATDIWECWAGPNGRMTRSGTFTAVNEQNMGSRDEDMDDSDYMVPEDNGPFYGLNSYIDGWVQKSWFYTDEAKENVEYQYKIKQLEKEHSETIEKAVIWILQTAYNRGETTHITWLEQYDQLNESEKKETVSVHEKLHLMITRWLASWGNVHDWKTGSHAQVVFGGFGKLDEFPKSIQISTGSRVNGIGTSDHLLVCRNIVDKRYVSPSYDEELKEWRSPAFLEPLAQNEFIMRMTTGQSTDLRGYVGRTLEESVNHWINNTLLEDISEVCDKDVGERIISNLNQKGHPKGFSEYLRSEITNFGSMKKNQFRDSIVRLSPHELGELTLDLIGVQAKMHNIVNPQSTVDLPVDVCYLSKENGFVWHRRKNMPDPSINPRLEGMKWPGSQLD